MFTGIVQAMGKVSWIQREPQLTHFGITFPASLLPGLKTGASVSIHGVCLTIVAINGDDIRFDIIEETLKRTTLGSLNEGDHVNLERSAKIGDEIGGHLLSGHIMGTGTIDKLVDLNHQRIVTIHCDPTYMKYIFPKGYIALNGASLTIVETDVAGYFTVHLIPETLRLTTFGRSKIDDKVNIEIDSQTQAIVETVKNILKPA
ncbi:MAG: riboflavin synthase subunit alpha [Candidatus Berkiellales bacterium]